MEEGEDLQTHTQSSASIIPVSQPIESTPAPHPIFCSNPMHLDAHIEGSSGMEKSLKIKKTYDADVLASKQLKCTFPISMTENIVRSR